jgi:hypothetical protein
VTPVLYPKRMCSEQVGGHQLFYISQRGGGRRAQYLAVCRFTPPCLPVPAPPFCCSTWLRSMFFHSRTPARSTPACIYPLKRSSQAHVLQLSATPLIHVFAPTSAAGSGPSGEQSIGAEMIPCFFACSTSGLPHVLIPGAPPLDLLKKSRTIT